MVARTASKRSGVVLRVSWSRWAMASVSVSDVKV
jgi:hypothetical protein